MTTLERFAVCRVRGENDNQGPQGWILFRQADPRQPVVLTISLGGFRERKRYAIHIHEFGDLRKGCTSLGPHWNPRHTDHGSHGCTRHFHAGDLINNLVPVRGRVDREHVIIGTGITLFGEETILGRSIVLHEHYDDLGLGGVPVYDRITDDQPSSVRLYRDMSDTELRHIVCVKQLTTDRRILHGSRERIIDFLLEGSRTTGNAGGRIACGVIGLASTAST